MTTMNSLFVPDIQLVLKHPTVLKTFDELQPGESFLLINDHDPIPLFYEMKAEKGEVFEWNKIESGPEVWKVEIKKIENVSLSEKSIKETSEISKDELFILNVTLIEPRLKHPTIFKHFDALKPGEAFQILNDHDPKPLYYQLIAERGNIFNWTYIEKGPAWWKVQIHKNDVENDETVGQIAAKDLRKAEVFKKYGIDFCCGGKKSLKQACEEKGLNVAAVEAELDNTKEFMQPVENYDHWNLDFLADYIYNKHHIYYYDEEPIISDLLQKVINRHGSHFPELQDVNTLYSTLTNELKDHFSKEEEIVFPFIKALVQANKTGNKEVLQSQLTLTQPVRLMESDHEAAGQILARLNQLTNGYNAPEGACNSFQFLYKKLKELEDDMHQHIHLENNILFPKAIELERTLSS